jgi:hypothetical protein
MQLKIWPSQSDLSLTGLLYPRTRPKIFVIGLNKTGTTSLGDALSYLGFLRLGWNEFLSRKLFHDYFSNDSANLGPMIEWTRIYDAFEDFPWPLVYEEMATLYPDAKFILSVRKDEEAWFKSIANHTERRHWVGHEMIYGALVATEESKERYIAKYREHNEKVREYFATQPERFMEICLDEGDDHWERLCTFLSVGDVPTVPFPKSNPKEAFWNVDHIGFFRAWDRFADWLERSMISWWYYSNNAPVRRIRMPAVRAANMGVLSSVHSFS